MNAPNSFEFRLPPSLGSALFSFAIFFGGLTIVFFSLDLDDEDMFILKGTIFTLLLGANFWWMLKRSSTPSTIYLEDEGIRLLNRRDQSEARIPWSDLQLSALGIVDNGSVKKDRLWLRAYGERSIRIEVDAYYDKRHLEFRAFRSKFIDQFAAATQSTEVKGETEAAIPAA